MNNGINCKERISLPSKPLTDKCAIITGASQGIGLEIARHFGAAGASLVLTEIQERFLALKEVSKKLEADYQVDILPLELDVRCIDQIRDIIGKAEERFPAIDILVNNAGANAILPAIDVTPEIWDMVVDINLKGAFFMSQEVGKRMIGNMQGCIINIASQHGVVGNDCRAPYCASKAGLINLTRSLAIEWAKYDIRVNSLSPTFVLTEGNKDLLSNTAFQRENLKKIPLGKYALPEDVANAALFLALPASKMITGHNLAVDGGWTAR